MARGAEIERKFLLSELPRDLVWEQTERIRQGYVALDGDVEVRVRTASGAGATLTVKSGGGRVRVEEELELPADVAAGLWELTAGRRLEKTRRRSPFDGLVLEVDEYEGDLSGLLVAEIEFPDEAAAERFAPPGWLSREVTDEAAYKNRSLACDGLPRE